MLILSSCVLAFPLSFGVYSSIHATFHGVQRGGCLEALSSIQDTGDLTIWRLIHFPNHLETFGEKGMRGFLRFDGI